MYDAEVLGELVRRAGLRVADARDDVGGLGHSQSRCVPAEG